MHDVYTQILMMLFMICHLARSGGNLCNFTVCFTTSVQESFFFLKKLYKVCTLVLHAGVTEDGVVFP